MSERLREGVERLCAAAEHDAALDGAATPLVSTYALRALLAAAAPTPERCSQCGPGYRLGDEGCRHGVAASTPDEVGQVEGLAAARAACDACDGSCAVCPYLAARLEATR